MAEKIGDFKILVFDSPEDDKAKVVIGISDDVDTTFTAWMCACEYFLHKTAQKSNAGYEKALELLCQGAMTYKDLEKEEMRDG